jgi:hypothetical protein
MIIKRKSVFSGVERTRNINIDPRDYAEYQAGYGCLADLAPYLGQEDREFILSGMTPQEWKNAFSDDIMKIVSDSFA